MREFGEAKVEIFRGILARRKGEKALSRFSRKLLTQFNKEGRNGSLLVEGFWDNPHHWLRLALFTAAGREKFGSRLLGLAEKSAPSGILSSMTALGVDRVVNLDATSGAYHSEGCKLAQGISTPHDLLELSLPFDYPSFLFYDGVLKKEKLGSLDRTVPKLAEYLAQILYYLNEYDRLLTVEKPACIVVSHPVHFRFSALVWQGIRHRVPVYVLNYAHEHITVRKITHPEEMQDALDNPGPGLIEKIPHENWKRFVQIGTEYLQKLRTGAVGEYSAIGIYQSDVPSGDLKRALEVSLGIDPRLPVVTIFTNCWPDFPNTYGPWHYSDYVEWFKATLHVIRTVPEANWIIKPHPAEYMYGNRVTLEDMIGDVAAPNIFIWPRDWPTNVVADVSDCVITARGSAGVEFPAIGVRTLVAGPTKYTSWGFVSFAKDAQEYESLLRRCWTLPQPSREEQERALVYVAFTYCAPPESQADGFQFRPGIYSQELWKDLPLFISRYEVNLRREAEMMREWLESDLHSYNVYKHLRHSEDDLRELSFRE